MFAILLPTTMPPLALGALRASVPWELGQILLAVFTLWCQWLAFFRDAHRMQFNVVLLPF